MIIGKMENTSVAHTIEWVIQNFFSLPEGDGNCYDSPTFAFNDESWYLSIYPNGSKEEDSSGYIDLYLMRAFSGPEMSQDFSLSLKNSDGKEKEMTHYTKIFKKPHTGHGCTSLISRSRLLRRKSELVPGNALTVVCTLKQRETTSSGSNNVTAKCSHCKETYNVEALSSHEKKCLDKPVKCPDCSVIVTVQNWYDHDCQTAKAEGVEAVCRDFKTMLLDGINHDLSLKIDERIFRAHQDVLRARSPVFKSMLTHDMVEKNSSIIDVPDCDAKTMEQFLSYIYSGNVEPLDQSNVMRLYYIADKYETEDLKQKCSNFIQSSLSPTNFCEVIQLALKHSDSKLKDFATEYFIDNVLDILQTVEWQSFLTTNSTVANELHIKLHEKKS